MKLFYDSRYACAGHGFDTTRKPQWIAESLAEKPIKGINLLQSSGLSIDLLRSVHEDVYIRAIKTGEPRELAQSQEFPWDARLWDAVLASNGGIVDATLTALKQGIAGSLSTGMHHARTGEGKGYCTFNGLVLAAKAAQREGAKNVLILDLDAHCGGGTHSLINDLGLNKIVHIDVSVNRYDQYPDENKGFALVHDAKSYLPVIECLLDMQEQPPDICIYNAGIDPYENCHEGGLSGITYYVLKQREELIFNWAKRNKIPIAFAMAGGYVGDQLDQASLVALHRLTLEAAISTHQTG